MIKPKFLNKYLVWPLESELLFIISIVSLHPNVSQIFTISNFLFSKESLFFCFFVIKAGSYSQDNFTTFEVALFTSKEIKV